MIPIASVIVGDPPWSFGDSLPGKTRGAAKQYACMSTEDLMALRIPPVADDALLFLWRVSSQVEEAYRVVRAWGFVPKSEIVWVKLQNAPRLLLLLIDLAAKIKDALPPDGLPGAMASFLEAILHFGMGRYVRLSHESCIVATRGKGKDLIQNHAVRSVFFAPTGAHSEKPEAFYRLVDKLVPSGTKVELFARRRRLGWITLGSDLGVVLEVGLSAPGRSS